MLENLLGQVVLLGFSLGLKVQDTADLVVMGLRIPLFYLYFWYHYVPAMLVEPIDLPKSPAPNYRLVQT
ncbi:hypothetical protein [Xenorhabdus beddingii]|uniref:hypothetical protein n=1 Tax=Xenorhabdus beddingii TaxID=40578 RepID=UPI000A326AB5|nr:hypothetical protein [Xenorhabdus beddingii]